MRQIKQPHLDTTGHNTSDPKVKEAIKSVEKVWRDFDTNENGYLSKEEFRPLHEEIAEEFSKVFIDLDCKDFEAFFKFFDKVGNGRIEKRKMLDIMVRFF